METPKKRKKEQAGTKLGERGRVKDFLAELFQLSGWTLVDDEETEKDLS